MLRDAEERSNAKKEEEVTTQVTEAGEEQPRRKAKTKFGNKSKKKGRKVKNANKGDGEEQYEVCVCTFQGV